MKGFFKVQTPDQLFQKLNRFQSLSVERVHIEKSLHRVIAEDVISPINLPEFPRSTVDGFALKAKDTYGASEKNPSLLRIAGEIPMGKVSNMELKDGEAVKVATGGMVPQGADAVEMVEYVEWIDTHTLHIFKTLSPLENVIQVGEDVKKGQVVLRKGRWIRPQEMGLMSGIGKTDLFVFLKPKVRIIPVGKERYDLIIPSIYFEDEKIQKVIDVIRSKDYQEAVLQMGGYDVSKTGEEIRITNDQAPITK